MNRSFLLSFLVFGMAAGCASPSLDSGRKRRWAPPPPQASRRPKKQEAPRPPAPAPVKRPDWKLAKKPIRKSVTKRQVRPRPQAPASVERPDWKLAKKPGRKSVSKWKEKIRVLTTLTYNSNIFKMSTNTKRRHDAGLPEILATGRFKNMEEPHDIIETFSVRGKLAGPSPIGNKLELSGTIQHNAYTVNSERSHTKLYAGLEHEIGDHGGITFRLKITPDYFPKNYFYEGFDDDLNGRISSRERFYVEGRYDAWDLSTEYLHRIAKRGKNDSFGFHAGLVKWEADGEKRVDMDIAVQTQLGPAYRCSGTLALPSRR